MRLGLFRGWESLIIGSAIDISGIMILQKAFYCISVKRTVSSYHLTQEIFLKKGRVPRS